MATIKPPATAAARTSRRANAVHVDAAVKAEFFMVCCLLEFPRRGLRFENRGSCILNRSELLVLTGLPTQTATSGRLVRPWRDVDQAWQDTIGRLITASRTAAIRARR